MSDCSIHRSCLRGRERGPGLHVEFSLKIALYTALRSKRSLLDRLTLYTPRSFSVERSRSPLFRISTHSAFLFPAPLTPRAILLRIASGRKPSFSDAVVGCYVAASPLSPPSSTHPPEQPPLLLAPSALSTFVARLIPQASSHLVRHCPSSSSSKLLFRRLSVSCPPLAQRQRPLRPPPTSLVSLPLIPSSSPLITRRPCPQASRPAPRCLCLTSVRALASTL